MSDNGGPDTGTPPNPITVFISRYFSYAEPERTRQVLETVAEFIKIIGADKFLAVVTKVATATYWTGGSYGPTEQEIQERITRTAEILSRHDFSDADAGKFFATILLMTKILPMAKS